MGHHAAKTELRAMKTALKYQYKAILVYEYFANCNKIGILKLSCEHNVISFYNRTLFKRAMTIQNATNNTEDVTSDIEELWDTRLGGCGLN